MTLAAINHKIENFSTELSTIEKEAKGKTYTRDESQRIGNRIEFLEQQLDILKTQKSDLRWAQATNTSVN